MGSRNIVINNSNDSKRQCEHQCEHKSPNGRIYGFQGKEQMGRISSSFWAFSERTNSMRGRPAWGFYTFFTAGLFGIGG